MLKGARGGIKKGQQCCPFVLCRVCDAAWLQIFDLRACNPRKLDSTYIGVRA